MKVLERIGRMKYIEEDKFNTECNAIYQEIDAEYETLMGGVEA